MQSTRLFLRRVFFGQTAAGKPSIAVRPQAFIQPTKSSDSTSRVWKTYPPEIKEENIDPANKDTWSRGPDLLWLHNTQDKQRKMLKAKFERNFPAPGTYTPVSSLRIQF